MELRKSLLLLSMLTLIAASAACSRKKETPPAQPVTIVISGPEEEPNTRIALRAFHVEPGKARAGEAIHAIAQLDAAHPERKLSVSWYAPDGWLVSYDVQSADAAQVKFTAPKLWDAGRYHAVLRAGKAALADDYVWVVK